jgi:hypothetical protein
MIGSFMKHDPFIEFSFQFSPGPYLSRLIDNQTKLRETSIAPAAVPVVNARLSLAWVL